MEKLPLKTVCTCIIVSVVVVWGTLFALWQFYREVKGRRATAQRYAISVLIQKSHTTDTVPTDTFSELLGLSADQPTNMYSFDVEEATSKLMACGSFKTVSIDLLEPAAIVVDYELRRPVAYLADFENAAIDATGYVFALSPFMTPKNIPQFVLQKGSQMEWNQRLSGSHIDLAMNAHKYLDFIKPADVALIKVDVSRAFLKTASREIVVVVAMNNTSVYLRLHPATYKERLREFFLLVPSMQQLALKDQEIVDLRLPHMALVKVV